MRNKNKLLIKQLDRKLEPFKEVRRVNVPAKGWIHSIRHALNMTMEQLGKRMGITKQGVKRIEESEVKGSLSLNTLKEVAEALDMKLVYALVPKKGSLQSLIDKKAKDLATKIVMRTHKNMQLENQAISDELLEEAINDLAEELRYEMKKSLWD